MKIRNSLNNSNLEKKLVFIVGGNGQIGSEITSELRKNGAKIVILDKYIKNKKLNYVYQEKFDCTKIYSVEKKIKFLIKKYGCPSILINTSYPVTSNKRANSFKKIQIGEFIKNTNYHLISYCWISKIFSDCMKKNKIHGSIINMGSIYGSLAQDMNLYEGTEIEESFTYPIIKGGLANFTKQMASYYGKNNIRINLINAGGIYGKSKLTNKRVSNKFLKRYEKKVPLKRMGYKNEIALCAVFLASSSSSYITGQTLTVDGGWSII